MDILYIIKMNKNSYSVKKEEIKLRTEMSGTSSEYTKCVFKNADVDDINPIVDICYTEEKLNNNEPIFVYSTDGGESFKAFSFIEPNEKIKDLFIKSAKEQLEQSAFYMDKELEKAEKNYVHYCKEKEKVATFINILDDQIKQLEQNEELER